LVAAVHTSKYLDLRLTASVVAALFFVRIVIYRQAPASSG
jgi:hypothetical protein